MPLVVIGICRFNKSTIQSWPLPGFSLHWFQQAFEQTGVRDALWTSIRAALGATAIALVLGSLAAFAVASLQVLRPRRHQPPGHPAHRAAGHRHGHGAQRRVPADSAFAFGIATIVIGHATFCMVIVYNNVHRPEAAPRARLEEASVDLGADSSRRSGMSRSRHPHGPDGRRPARVRAVLRRGHRDHVHRGRRHRDDPHWILKNFSRTNRLPIVNAVASFVVLLSVFPVWAALKLTDGSTVVGAP